MHPIPRRELGMLSAYTPRQLLVIVEDMKREIESLDQEHPHFLIVEEVITEQIEQVHRELIRRKKVLVLPTWTIGLGGRFV